MKENIRILSLPVDQGGCGWYRIRQPFQMINNFTNNEAHVVDDNVDSGVEILKALWLADVLVIRQGGEVGLYELKKALLDYSREINKPYHFPKVVLDIDDNIELISPYSQHYEDYGVNDFFDKKLDKWLWKDKESFDVHKNRNKVMSLMRGLREVDLVTVTTNKLAEYARQFNPNVAVLPNCIDSQKWWKLPFKENEQLRVGWSGGVSHYEDWYSIKEPLNRLLRKYRFKLISVGAHFEGVIDEDLRDLVEVWPWVPFEAHSYRMMCMNLDIAIIPLANSEFNQNKSSIKFYEMSSMGVPSVVSDVLPYSQDITTDNSMPYSSPTEFEYALERLIKDKTHRRLLSRNSLKWVTEKDAKNNVSLWVDAYKQLL